MESLKELQRTPARTLFITDNVSVLGTELQLREETLTL